MSFYNHAAKQAMQDSLNNMFEDHVQLCGFNATECWLEARTIDGVLLVTTEQYSLKALKQIVPFGAQLAFTRPIPGRLK